MAVTRNSEMELIRQTGTISDYCNDFQDWFERVKILEGFSDFYGVYLFICGLKPEIWEIFVDWHQYSCNRVEDVISLALKIDSNGLQDSFSPFDPTSSFYRKELEFDFRISLDEIMKDNEFFKNGKIPKMGEDLFQEISKDDVNVPELFDDINSKEFEKDDKNEVKSRTIENACKVFDKMPMNIILNQDLMGEMGNNIELLGIEECSKNGFEVLEHVGNLTFSLGPSKFGKWKWHKKEMLCVNLDIWKWPIKKKKCANVPLRAVISVLEMGTTNPLEKFKIFAEVIFLMRLNKEMRLFDATPCNDSASWNTVIGGYTENGKINEALKLFNWVWIKTAISWNSIIATCEKNRQYTILEGYVQLGNFDEVFRLFVEMKDETYVAWWTAVISCYEKKGRSQVAWVMFKKRMKEKIAEVVVIGIGDRFRCPGGSTMFCNGVDSYIDDINELTPLSNGTIRTAIEVMIGVESAFGQHLQGLETRASIHGFFIENAIVTIFDGNISGGKIIGFGSEKMILVHAEFVKIKIDYFVWATLFAKSACIRYEEKNIYMAAYDWRLLFLSTECTTTTGIGYFINSRYPGTHLGGIIYLKADDFLKREGLIMLISFDNHWMSVGHCPIGGKGIHDAIVINIQDLAKKSWMA